MSFGASGNTPDPYFAFSWARMAAWTAGSLDCRGWGKKGEEQKTKKKKSLYLDWQKLDHHFVKTMLMSMNLKP